MHPELRKEIKESTFCGRSSILDMIDNFELREELRSHIEETENVSIDWKYVVRVNVIVSNGTKWEPIYRVLRQLYGTPFNRLKVSNGSIEAMFRIKTLQHIYFSAAFPECQVTLLREGVEPLYKIECGSGDLEQQVLSEDALNLIDENIHDEDAAAMAHEFHKYNPPPAGDPHEEFPNGLI